MLRRDACAGVHPTTSSPRRRAHTLAGLLLRLRRGVPPRRVNRAPPRRASTSPRPPRLLVARPTPRPRARARSSVPSFRRAVRSPLSASGEGARLCDEGDLIFAGVGAGAIKDPVAAFERYLEAATRHAHVPAMARVARCYASGEGRAFQSLRVVGVVGAGAAAGDADAVNLLGARRGGRPDARRARGCVGGRRAVPPRRGVGVRGGGAQSRARARARIRRRGAGSRRGGGVVRESRRRRGRGRAVRAGALLRSGASDPDGVTDTAGAFRWFSAAAERGSADGLNALAMMHEDGTVPGRAADLEEAKALYVRAADKGHAHAHNNLGYVHAAVGEHEEAARRFRAAADRGDADAMHNLGALHESGVGVRKGRARGAAAVRERRGARTRQGGGGVSAPRGERGRGRRWGRATARGRRLPPPRPRRSLRRQLAAKEKETSRLAKELGESKAECGRLKSTVADLRGAIREHEKEAARLRAEAPRPASPAKGAGADRAPEFTRSTSLTSNKSNYSNYSGLSGVSGQSGGSGDGSPAATANATANATARRPAPSGPSRGRRSNRRGRDRPGRSPACSANSRWAGRNARRREPRRRSRSRRTIARCLPCVGELEAATSRAELHEEMSATLSEVLRATYARNLQLEELLRKVGVDPDDPAIECELTPIAVETVAGYDVSQLDAGREGVGPGGELGPGARGARHENGAADAPTREGTRSRRCRRRGRETRGEETEDGTGSRAMDDRRRSDADDDPRTCALFWISCAENTLCDISSATVCAGVPGKVLGGRIEGVGLRGRATNRHARAVHVHPHHRGSRVASRRVASRRVASSLASRARARVSLRRSGDGGRRGSRARARRRSAPVSRTTPRRGALFPRASTRGSTRSSSSRSSPERSRESCRT